MRHARPQDLEPIAPLLADLRKLPELKEKTFGIFYRGSKAFLHFHEDAGDLFADLRSGGDFTRFPASTQRDQNALLKLVRAALAAQRK
jgi:hypothetical protein